MPQLSAITIADGATTPVNHVFSPVSTNGAKAELADRSPSSPAGYLTLVHEVNKPAAKEAAYRVKMGFNVPVMATVDGVPTVVRFSTAQVTFNCSQQGTEQERKDLLAYVKNALANATVADTVIKLEPLY